MATQKKIRAEDQRNEDADRDEWAEQINKAYGEYKDISKTGRRKAVEIGTLLLERWDKHKQDRNFLRWFDATFPFSRASAYLYMDLAKLVKQLPDEVTYLDKEDLSIRESVAYLKEQQAEKEKEEETIDDQTLHSFEKFSKSLMGMPDPSAWLTEYGDMLAAMLPIARLTLISDSGSRATDSPASRVDETCEA